MRETPLKSASEIEQQSSAELLDLVRSACEMLLSTQPDAANSIRISQTFADRGGSRLIRRTALEMAQQYGLRAEVLLKRDSVEIRLSRPVAKCLR
jgi:hypothetical protein